MNLTISNEATQAYINRITNQIWKLIPMRENNEDWNSQLDTVLIEILGLSALEKSCTNSQQLISLAAKLKGLQQEEIKFSMYRKTIFECISLLREMWL